MTHARPFLWLTLLLGLVALGYFASGSLPWAPEDGEPSSSGALRRHALKKHTPQPTFRQTPAFALAQRAGQQLHGRVIDSSGAGLRGALVVIRPSETQAATAMRSLTADCDADGYFSSQRLAPGRYLVSAAAPGHFSERARTIEIIARGEREALTLKLSPGQSQVTGTISDLLGGEIEGALVVAHQLRQRNGRQVAVRSDAHGSFKLSLSPGAYALRVSHEDYAAQGTRIDLRKGARVRDFALAAMSSVTGTVRRSSDGQPVAGAHVHYATHRIERDGPLGHREVLDARSTVITDADGQFLIRNLASGTLSLHAVAPGAASRQPEVLAIDIAERIEGVRLDIAAAPTLRGTVYALGDDSRAIAGATVELESAGGMRWTSQSDPDGRFEMHGVHPGQHRLRARADHYLPMDGARRVDVPEQGSPANIDIHLDPGLEITGQVLPPQKARVQLSMAAEQIGMGKPGTTAFALTQAEVATDDRGYFKLSPVPHGEFLVLATGQHGARGQSPVDTREGTVDDVRVGLETGGSVSGEVVDGQGQPVADAFFVLTPLGDAQSGQRQVIFNGRKLGTQRTPTGEHGDFELRGLDRTNYRIAVFSEAGHELERLDAEQPSTLNLTQTTNISDLRVRVEARNARIAGRLLDDEGQAVADAWVRAWPLPKLQADRDDSAARNVMELRVDDGRAPDRAHPAPRVLTDAHGRFTIGGLRQGDYFVEARAHGSGLYARADKVQSDSTITLKAEPLAEVSGRVRFSGKVPKTARLQLTGPSQRRLGLDQGEQAFAFDRLEPGAYGLKLHSPLGTSTQQFKVAAGEHKTIDLLVESWAEVTGRVLDGKGQPVVGAQIVFGEAEGKEGIRVELDGNEDPSQTDEAGRFSAKVAAGPRVLLAMHPEAQRPVVIHRLTAISGETHSLGELKARTPGPEGMAERRRGAPGHPGGPRGRQTEDQDVED